MIDGLRHYAEMKPSGLPWLGDMPAHWELRPNRSLLRKRKVLVGENHPNYLLLSLTKNGVIVRDVSTGRGKFSSDMGTSQEVRVGDLVFCLFDVPETPRTVGLSKFYGMITGAYTVLESLNPDHSKYLEAFYIAMDDRKLLAPLYSGLRNTIPPSVFLGIKSPIPPLDEQRLIVRFLDWHGAQTAKLIRAKKKIIALLNEQKQAIIHRAVTRGLDPDVRLKPSDIPTFGQVPETWELERLKTVFREKSQKGFPNEPMLAATQTMGVVRKDVYGKRTVLALKDLHLLKFVDVNDFVISLRSFEGGIEYARDRGIISPAYTILECRDKKYHPYLAMLLKSLPFVQLLQLNVTGIREGQNINYEQLSRSRIPIPPSEEAIAIVGWANDASKEIDQALDAVQREVVLIHEFRTRLIADVVTGKLDVRAAASCLPETVELEPIDDLVEGDDLDGAVDDAENEEVAA